MQAWGRKIIWLLAFALLAVPLMSVVFTIRLAYARPSPDLRYAEAYMEKIESRRERYAGDPDIPGQYMMLAAVDQHITAAIEPIARSFGMIHLDRYSEYNLNSRFGPWCAFEDIEDQNAYWEDEPAYGLASELNAVAREHARLAIEAIQEQHVLDSLDRITKASFDPPYNLVHPASLFVPYDHAMLYRINRWMWASYRLEAEQEDWAGMVRMLHRLRAIQAVIAREPHPIAVSQSLGNDSYTLELMIGIVLEHSPPRDVIARILDEIQMNPLTPALSDAIEVERLILLDFAELSHSRGGIRLPEAAMYIGSTPPPGPMWANVSGLFTPRKHVLVDAVEAYITSARASVGQRRALRTLNHVPLDDVLDQNSAFGLSWYLALPSLYYRLDRHASMLVAVKTILAIELHRYDHGAPPHRLEQLVGDYLPQIPEDPYATDGRFVYVIDDTSAQGYRLHSVGPDGRDDGGRLDDIVFVPRPEN